MKLLRTSLLTFGALALMVVQSAVAAPVTAPTDGDIFIAFRATSGTGANSSYLIKVGNQSTFRSATPGSTISLPSVGTDLDALFGSGWHTDARIHWGAFGAENNANPSVYASKVQNPVGTPATDFNALGNTERTSTKNQIVSVISAYRLLEATGNPTAGIQTNASNSGSYSFQVTGTTSFGTLSQWTNIEGDFNGAGATKALDLFGLSGSTARGNVVKRLGTFSITNTGDVTFTAAAVVNEVSFDQINYAVQEDASAVTLTVIRSGDLSQAATATYSITETSAVAGTDYTAPVNFTVNFAASDASEDIVIPILDRTTGYYGDRVFKATLVSATGGFIVRAPSVTTVTITDLDPASALTFAEPTVSFPQLNLQGTANTISLTVNRVGTPAGSVSVQVAATGGSLNSTTHYTFTSPQIVTFYSNETSKVITIPLKATAVPGTINFTLSSPTGSAELGATTTSIVTVTANTGIIAFAGPTASATTANDAVTVTLFRTVGNAGAVSVTVAATGGSLVNGTDFDYEPTIVNFASGENSATTTVLLNTLTIGTIELTVSNPTNSATIGTQNTITISVAGAPGALTFEISKFSYFEEAGIVNIPIKRVGGIEGEVKAYVTTASDSAVSPNDFVPLTNYEVTFPNGVTTATVPVSIVLDNVKNEANETFKVTLVSPTVVGEISVATVTIVDLDTVKPVVVLTNPKANEKIAESNNDSFSLVGTATDNKGVAKIEVQLNGGLYEDVPFTVDNKGKASFNYSLEAERGTNILNIRSIDTRGNVSVVVTRNFVYDDPFALLAGTYNGLALTSGLSVPSNQNNGFVNVVVQKTGAFTGKLTIDGLVLSFTGVIGDNGTARFGALGADKVRVERPNKPSFEIAFALNLTKNAPTNRITGTVTEYNRAVVASTAAIEADRAGFNGTTTKVPDYFLENNGNYTVLFPLQETQSGLTALDFPQAPGVGTVTVKANGTVTLAATLSDGTKVTSSGLLWSGGVWPFYAELYTKRGSIGGQIAFEDITDSDFSGEDLFWFRPYQNVQHYPYGWPEGLKTVVQGAKYDPNLLLPSLGAVSPVLGNADLEFNNGLLAEDTVKAVNIETLTGKTTNAPVTDKSFTLTLTKATGLFKGAFTHSDGTKPPFQGAIYQKGSTPRGYGNFLSTAPKVRDGTGEAGAVTLQAK